jgi:hypothetical protein
MGARGHGDESEEHELRSACSALARFLGQLVAGHEKWSRYYWVDSVPPSLAAVVSDEELSVLGSVRRLGAENSVLAVIRTLQHRRRHSNRCVVRRSQRN